MGKATDCKNEKNAVGEGTATAINRTVPTPKNEGGAGATPHEKLVWEGTEKELIDSGMWEHIPYDHDDSVPPEEIYMRVELACEEGEDVIYFYVYTEYGLVRLSDQTILRKEDPKWFQLWENWLKSR